jgi:hypothetical protein
MEVMVCSRLKAIMLLEILYIIHASNYGLLSSVLASDPFL